MKAILFFSTLLFSVSSFSATAITLNGLSWKTINTGLVTSPALHNSVLSMYENCGLTGNACDDSGWRWANQAEVNQLVSDLFNIDYKPTKEGLYIETDSFFNYFTPTMTSAPSVRAMMTFSSNIIKESDGPTPFYFGGDGSFYTVFQDYRNGLGELDAIFDSSAIPQSGTRDISELLWAVYSFNQYKYDYSNSGIYANFMMVKGDYDPSLGITYPVTQPSAVPLPASAFLFAPALLGFMGLRRTKSS